MNAEIAGAAFVGAVFAFALLVYLIFLQWRKVRYRRLAADLGATFEDQGFAATGGISGVSAGREYTVSTKAAGRSGMWSVISANCANRGARFTVDSGFFKKFPDWRFVRMQDDEPSAGPGVSTALIGAGGPISNSCKAPMQELFRESSLQHGEILKKGRLRIDRGMISYTRHGVLADAGTVRQIIVAIAEIASRIESLPVI